MMETVRIQTGATERITAVALSSALAALTGLTDFVISIQRVSDGQWFDFSDLTFKAAGWTTRQQAMTEISSTLAAGQYYYDFNTATITNATANDAYLVTVTQTPGVTVKNIPQVGEIKVGQYADNLNATVSSRATAAALATVQADTDDIQTRLPAALVGGRIDASVGAMAAGVVTAAAVATNAIDADAIAADAVTEIQAGLATAAALAAVQADTDDLQTRVPATLTGGRMRSHVEAMDSDVIGAAQIAAGAIGTSEAPLLDAAVSSRATQAQILSDATPFQGARIDAAISSRAAPGAAMALTPAERTAVDAQLSGTHGAGSWEGSTAAAVATAVWNEALPGAHPAGSAGKLVGDDLDAKVSSRASPADVGSSLTVYGAATGAQVATRAAPGDAMDLVTDAVDATSLAVSAVAEIEAGLAAIHGAGSWEGGGTPASIATAVWNEVLPGAYAAGRAGKIIGDRVDAAVSSRAAPGAAMALTPAERLAIDAALSGVHGAGSWEGATPTQIWSELLPGAYTPGQAGKIVGDRLDAAVGTRAVPLDAMTLTAGERAAIDGVLAAAHGLGSWEGATPAQIWSEFLPGAYAAGQAGKIIGDRVDAAVSSRAVPGDAMALTPAERLAVDGELSGAHGGGAWGGATTADFWSEPLPGAYAPGEAGRIVGERLDVAVGTRAVPGSAMTLTSGERAAVAGTVWNEAIPGTHGPGTAAAKLEGVDGRVDVAVSSRAAPGDAMALTAGELNLIGGRVWDENLPGAHAVGTAGERLASADGQLDAAVSTRAAPGDVMALSPGERAAVAAAAWDEVLPGAHAAGTAGERLASTDNRVDVPSSSRAVPGDAMALTVPERAAVAGAVWDEVLGTHAAGTAGYMVAELEARLTVARAAALDQIAGITSSTTLLRKIKVNRLELSEAGGGTWILYDDDDVTPLLTWPVRDKDGGAIRMNSFVPARRGRGT